MSARSVPLTRDQTRAGLGAVGYATRRDLSSWYRVLFCALLALIAFGIVAIFVSMPDSNLFLFFLQLFGGGRD